MRKVTAANTRKMNTMDSKSSKIRYLADEGFSRVEIKNILKLRYQHVRNVLVEYELKKEIKKLRNN